MFSHTYLIQQMQKMHQLAPLVQCITNDVVTNFTANVLLAIGASPAMVIAPEESGDFARIACALSMNIGTLTSAQAQAMKLAVVAAQEIKTPWVLDPVAFGALRFRRDFCLQLLEHRPAVIRGNASEIAAMAGQAGKTKGADSVIESEAALEAAKILAKKYQTVVALTGQTDYVTDGQAVYALNNGHIQLTRVTGTGCSLSAMVAAYCAICATPVLAALCGLSHMAIAGELAAAQTEGVGSFAVSLLDHLQGLAEEPEERVQWQKI